WPFSTMGWPEKTAELEYYYPTNVLVTGYDIIFFWVARMIAFGLEVMEEKPFNDVFLHGIVRDSQGRKMSKSLGNGIDPLEVIEKYGADALRFTLVTGNSPGNDTRFYYERVEANRNFCNKIWNASRFVMMNLTVDDFTLPENLSIEDKWILTLYNQLVKEVTENIEKYELGVAADKLYSFIWDYFCDWYIELCKTRLSADADKQANECAQKVLGHVLVGTLKLLHPFMPFITETIWQALPHEGKSIMVSEWEKFDEKLVFPDAVAEMEQIMDVVRVVRNRRSEMNVPPSKRASLTIVTESPELFAQAEPFLKKLAWASDVIVCSDMPANADSMVSCATNVAHVFMPLSELVDTEKEKARINGEIEKAKKFVASLEAKLSNENFVAKAPAAVVAAEREKLEKNKALIAKLEDSLRLL
ncbi:MAG: class I tRNA ligase family protein, partial [Clostridia bacterium]|nr:class I tRNA ligase family protein [Clostridia bacterium]